MAQWKIATRRQRLAYQETKPVYPLHALTTIPLKATGEKLPVFIEDLRGCGGRYDPKWEAVPPAGYMFESNEVHSLLGYDQKDLKDRLGYETLVPCWHDGCCLPDDIAEDRALQLKIPSEK